MKASIVQIGNSRGVRIPKIMLEESGFDKEVEIKAKKGEIKITPAKKQSKKIHYNEEYLLSLPSLAKEWDTPEEDAAWAHLQ
jgi:antitoxin component of MazEF toxin-antitoxin module